MWQQANPGLNFGRDPNYGDFAQTLRARAAIRLAILLGRKMALIFVIPEQVMSRFEHSVVVRVRWDIGIEIWPATLLVGPRLPVALQSAADVAILRDVFCNFDIGCDAAFLD